MPQLSQVWISFDFLNTKLLFRIGSGRISRRSAGLFLSSGLGH